MVRIVIIYDIESSTHDGIDANKNRLKVFAYYNTETKEAGVLRETEREVIKKVLSGHDTKVGFNNKSYDDVILRREGYRINGQILDLYEIVRKKQPVMRTKFKSYSLKNVCKTLGLDAKSDDMNYEWLNDDTLIEQHWKEIKKYTEQDITITKQLWEYVNNFFKPFADPELISLADARAYKHLTMSSGSYAYKVICRKAGLPEEYNDNAPYEHYDGGYFSKPEKELTTGNIYCLDFASAYPHSFIQANLYSNRCNCCKEEEKYAGGTLFKLSGRYCTKKQGKIEKTIQWLYNRRQELKTAGDNREYAYKIVLNTIYGIAGNAVFKNVYNVNTVSDCTQIARTMIKLAKKRFVEAGYEFIYTATDSVYLKDPYNNEAKILLTKERIIKEIKESFLFPAETFDMGVDDRIKLIYFPGLKKSNYMYVTIDNDIKIKGLPFWKDNASPMSMHVFKKYIKQGMIENDVVKHDPSNIRAWIQNELKTESGLKLVMTEHKVRRYEEYKLASQLQAQISKAYGRGIHHLIPNNAGVGVGKGKSYCTLEEFKNAKLTSAHVDLKKVYNELQIFSNGPLDNTVKTRRREGKIVNNSLAEWIK